MWVNREYSRGLRKQPLGGPVLRVSLCFKRKLISGLRKQRWGTPVLSDFVGEQGVQQRPEDTALGDPVLIVIVEEVLLSILTACGLPVRKTYPVMSHPFTVRLSAFLCSGFKSKVYIIIMEFLICF